VFGVGDWRGGALSPTESAEDAEVGWENGEWGVRERRSAI